MELLGGTTEILKTKVREISYCDDVTFPLTGQAEDIGGMTGRSIEIVYEVFAAAGLVLSLGVGKTEAMIVFRGKNRGNYNQIGK